MIDEPEAPEAAPAQIPGPPCDHCGFSPVTNEEWRAVVLANLGDNARAAIEQIAGDSTLVGVAAGVRQERGRLAEMLTGLLNGYTQSELGLPELMTTLHRIAENLDKPRA